MKVGDRVNLVLSNSDWSGLTGTIEAVCTTTPKLVYYVRLDNPRFGQALTFFGHQLESAVLDELARVLK